jgi:hypothetical protein
MQGRCISEDYDVVPCDGNEMAKVLKVAPLVGCFLDASDRHPDGTWLCLRYR